MINEVSALSSPAMQQLASSMTIAGAAVGSFLDVVPWVLGFRATLLGPIALLFTAGSIACSFPGLAFLLPGRFATGLAAGLTGIVAPVLLAETTAPAVRGKLTSMHQFGVALGGLLSSVIGLAFVSWRDLFCSEAHRHMLYPVFVGSLLILGLNCCGLNVLLLYSSRIFEFIEVGDPMISTAIVFGVYVAATLAGAWLMDVLGRKTLLLGGYAVMVVVLLGVGACLLAVGPENKEIVGWVALGCIVAFVCAYALGPGVATFVVLSEIVPTAIRVRAFSIFMSINWGVQLVLALLALEAIDSLGTAASGPEHDDDERLRRGVGALFLAFGAVSALTLLAVMALVPETRGASLEAVRRTMLARWKLVKGAPRASGSSGGSGSTLCAWCCCCPAGRAASAMNDVMAEDSGTVGSGDGGSAFGAGGIRTPMLEGEADAEGWTSPIAPLPEGDDEAHRGPALGASRFAEEF
ncbi:hypothetical protein FNF31_00411 [Cafeteria roenbergensis]|uniref:Major facilitator superfamily (MFS) profile domain-containing protein n=1 Tax=Cafeteria roenbergensis TaxID=33653 RepID=A0A5A8DXT2_CAFRO|nr:hypothetical protein FNF31_00411 [Cafeteria roenbergensis]KAA0171185.1 hypothetical protein FNF28_00951 [Cafeteria roenbergensis]